MTRGQRLADAVMRAAAEKRDGIRIESAADYDRLWKHRLDNLDAVCWPGRTKKRLLVRGLRCLARMHGRVAAIEHDRWFGCRVAWVAVRFMVWVALFRVLLLFVPPCWCRKGGKDAG